MPTQLPDDGEFVALAAFPLAWRWTDAKWDLLTGDELAIIRPLSPSGALRINAEALRRHLSTVAEPDLTIPAYADDPAPVRERLNALPIAPDTDIVVNWDQNTAALTKWHLFVSRWDSFCYPSSDDVTVWAPGQHWTVSYHHEELFLFLESDASAA